MKRFIEFKRKSAQQLVEFLLIAPFMIIILGILLEYAYALNVNMTLTQGLKESTASMYHDVRPNMAVADIQTTVQTNLERYLSNNNVPNAAANQLNVTYVPVGNTTVFMASYKYLPAFSLPNLYFKFLPNEFNFLANSAVPTAFLNSNNYGAALNTSTLSNVWSGGSKGIMNTVAGRNQMLFLLPTTALGLTSPYQIKTWDGSLQPYTLDTADGKLYSCTVTCSDSGDIFKTYYSAYSNIIFIDDSGAIWNDVLNRSLGLADTNGLTRGNYDNINVAQYNPSIVSPIPTFYSVKAVGGTVFTYASTDNISMLQ